MKNILKKIFMDSDKIAVPSARSVFLRDTKDATLTNENEFLFFSSLKLVNGTTKTTERNRLRDVDEWLLGFMANRKTQNVLDVAISSGVTTVELCELFDLKKFAYEITGLDSDITAFLLILNDRTSVLLDKLGNVLHFEIHGKGFGYVKGTNIQHWLEREIIKLRAKLFIKYRTNSDLVGFNKSGRKTRAHLREVKLVCREILENPKIKLLEESLFSNGNGEKYDLIRAANILNKAYFSDSEISEALRSTRNKLKEGGLLLICRTNSEGQNNASIFILENEKEFKTLGRFGQGSEIENLVLHLGN